MRRSRSLLAVGAAATLALSACGSDEPDSASASDDSAGAEESLPTGAAPEEPLPLGETVRVYDWEVTITDVQLDVTADVEEALTGAHFSSYQEPTEGNQYAMVTLEGTWVGDEEYNSFYSEVLVHFQDGETVYEEPCSLAAPWMDFTGSIPQGETITSSWCVEIPSDLPDDAVIELRDYVVWVEPAQSQFYFETS